VGAQLQLELRWDGVPSLADALRMLKEQAARTPAPQWVRVIGGWNEFQFAERRMPTLDEINAVATDTPVFVMHLYDRALLNAAACGRWAMTRRPNFPAGEVQRDRHGNPRVCSSPSQRQHSLFHLAKGRSSPAKINSILHGSSSRAQSFWYHQRYRRGWRISELSRRLRRSE